MEFKNLDFYNGNIKKEFLSQYPHDSQITFGYTLVKATSTERALKKDLYAFNEDEIALVLHNISPINLPSALRYAGVIGNYIDWAIEKGLASSNLNPLDGFPREWYKQFVGDKKLYISLRELEDIEKDVVNYQDKLPLRLAFEGILGEDMSEQSNLDKYSYEINSNTVTVKCDIKGERTIEVSDKCIAMIDATFREETYYTNNGMSEGKAKERSITPNKYVLRTSGKSSDDTRVSKFVLYKRLRSVKEWFDYPLLSYKNLQKSGMIKMAVDLYEERGKLDSEELYIIGEKFNISKVTSGENEHYPVSIMKEYINRDNILDLYGIDINA